MAGTCGAIEDNPWRDHFGSVCGGRPSGRGETRRRPGGLDRKADKRGRGGGGEETRDSDVLAGALAH